MRKKTPDQQDETEEFDIINDEEEVEDYLEAGWKFVNKLNDNKCIVEK